MGNVLLFILSFGAIPFIFYISYQLFNRLVSHFSSEDYPELEEETEATLYNQ